MRGDYDGNGGGGGRHGGRPSSFAFVGIRRLPPRQNYVPTSSDAKQTEFCVAVRACGIS